MACPGACTVRIFNVTQGLTVLTKPPHVDQEAALRALQSALDKKTANQKETGCKGDGCSCTPLADYMPDAAGTRKKEPDWSQPIVKQIRVNVGSGENIEWIIGTAGTQSAIVPGLCEETVYLDYRLPAGSPTPE
jgi:hypothetical protein